MSSESTLRDRLNRERTSVRLLKAEVAKQNIVIEKQEADAKDQQEKINELNQSVINYEHDVAHLINANKKLTEDLEICRANASKARMDSQISAMQKETAMYKQGMNELKKKLKISDEEAQMAISRADDLNQQVDDLREQVEKAQERSGFRHVDDQELFALRERVIDYENNIRDLNEQIAFLESKFSPLEEKVRSQAETIDNLNAYSKSQRAEVVRLQKDNQTMIWKMTSETPRSSSSKKPVFITKDKEQQTYIPIMFSSQNANNSIKRPLSEQPQVDNKKYRAHNWDVDTTMPGYTSHHFEAEQSQRASSTLANSKSSDTYMSTQISRRSQHSNNSRSSSYHSTREQPFDDEIDVSQQPTYIEPVIKEPSVPDSPIVSFTPEDFQRDDQDEDDDKNTIELETNNNSPIITEPVITEEPNSQDNKRSNSLQEWSTSYLYQKALNQSKAESTQTQNYITHKPIERCDSNSSIEHDIPRRRRRKEEPIPVIPTDIPAKRASTPPAQMKTRLVMQAFTSPEKSIPIVTRAIKKEKNTVVDLSSLLDSTVEDDDRNALDWNHSRVQETSSRNEIIELSSVEDQEDITSSNSLSLEHGEINDDQVQDDVPLIVKEENYESIVQESNEPAEQKSNELAEQQPNENEEPNETASTSRAPLQDTTNRVPLQTTTNQTRKPILETSKLKNLSNKINATAYKLIPKARPNTSKPPGHNHHDGTTCRGCENFYKDTAPLPNVEGDRNQLLTATDRMEKNSKHVNVNRRRGKTPEFFWDLDFPTLGLEASLNTVKSPSEGSDKGSLE